MAPAPAIWTFWADSATPNAATASTVAKPVRERVIIVFLNMIVVRVIVFVRNSEVDQPVDGVLGVGGRLRTRILVEVRLIDVEHERGGYIPLMREPVRAPANPSRSDAAAADVLVVFEMVVAQQPLPAFGR